MITKITHVFRNEKKKIPNRDLVGLILVNILWASCYPLIATGLAAAPPLYFAALRSFVAGAGLIAPALVFNRPFPRGRVEWAGIIGVGVTTTTLGFTGMFLAGGLLSPGLATILGNTQPLIAAVLAFVFLRERLGPARKKGLALGFMGILLIALPGLAITNPSAGFSGIGYILIGASGVAIGNVLLKRLAGRGDLLMAMGLQFLIGGLLLLMFAWIFEAPFRVSWDLPFIINLLFLGLAGTALAFGLWFALLHRGELTRMNTFTFLTPVIATAIGVLFFSESLGPISAVGSFFVLVGVWQTSRTPPEGADGRNRRYHLEEQY